MTLDEKLLQILACPACKAAVTLSDPYIECTQCHRKFPLRDDIPIMLLSEAIEPQGGKTPADQGSAAR